MKDTYYWYSDDSYIPSPIRLAEYRRDLAEVQEIEPDLGRYEPDLFPDYRLDADLDPFYPLRPVRSSPQPDSFYYAAQGQEVPQQAAQGYQGGRWSFKAVMCWLLFWVVVAEIVLLVAGY